jgi:hypothetical protein
MLRGLVRQAGWRFAVTGFGGSLLALARSAATTVDARLGAGGRIAAFPLAVPVGLAVAYTLERRRVLVPDGESAPAESPSPVRSLALAGAAVGGLTGVAYAEHALATTLGRRLATVLPGGTAVW